jgi:hypothetical protein
MKSDLLLAEMVKSFIESTCKNSSARLSAPLIAGGNISMMASAHLFFLDTLLENDNDGPHVEAAKQVRNTQ